MQWTPALIRLASDETLIENVIELLKRMGFREYERVSGKKEWGIDVVAIRDDPIAGTEKVVLALHSKGLASSKDVNVFADLVDKYKADKGIIISPVGFTKDAKVLISREHRGRIVPWDGEKLASLFNNYSLEPPEDLIEALESKADEEKEESSLKEFELDAPLLHEFSPEAVLKRVASAAVSKYPIKSDEVKLDSVSVLLSSAYIFSWSVERDDGTEEKDKAVVFSKERMVLRAIQDKVLSVPITKALLNDGSVIHATEREIDVPISPSEAVFILKETASKELGVPEGRIKIHERKKVYIPKKAELSLRVGENTARAEVDLENDEVRFEISPLPDEYFVERTAAAVEAQTGEAVVDYSLKRAGGKVKVSGKTERFSFELSFNEYTGKLLGMEALMSDEALDELLMSAYPEGQVVNLEKGKKVAVADILIPEGIAVMQVDLTSGKHREARRIPSPETAFGNARKVIEENFPLRNLELRSYRVLEHKYLELNMESSDGKAAVKVDGQTGDILDYVAEVTPERARELASQKYAGFEVTVAESGETEYVLKAENDRHVVTIKVSRDGKLIEEADRVLRREVAEELAERAAKEVDEEAVVKNLALNENWEVEFAGRTKTGKLVLHRATGEVVEKDVRFTEMAIKEAYLAHVKEKHGEENPVVERMTLYEEKGYVHIKVEGKENLYYARIDLKSGKVISEDVAPTKGLTAKLKQFQLENKYK
ncbi:restriction endonuclease [Thermococcus pacificus]|uniref:Restriction endonuclease n=1 Tax=Thermococcus pacificus TaxID=71998 RepID=A0A218P9J3_9EURY|nr:restriction endonuclease [Thermococcus pacificus]ASJ07447.1 restriction endonuclease [Thermococcus pacificus]